MSLERLRQRLGEGGGLKDFGVNLTRLPPGNWSSQRHWHSHEDEFVYVLEGELTLIEDDGETLLRANDCAAFPKNDPNGHHLINKSSAMVTCLEVGTRSEQDVCQYPDIDLMISDVIMPGLDGPTMLKKARKLLGDAPVMFISGYAEAEFSDLLR